MLYLQILANGLVLGGLYACIASGFSLVWVANFYMSLFGRLRLDIKHEGVEIAAEQETLVSRKAAVTGASEASDVLETRR